MSIEEQYAQLVLYRRRGGITAFFSKVWDDGVGETYYRPLVLGRWLPLVG